MKNRANIVLTGFMGTGKTTVGRLVADRLQWEFLDTDEEIVRRESLPIPQIFESYGESHFRAVEKELCKELASRKDLVVATGGGMPADPENRRLLASNSTVICLRCAPSEILARVNSGAGRPMLQDTDLEERIAFLLNEREEAYASLPFHIDTSALSVDDVAERVLTLFKISAPDSKFLSVSIQGSAGYMITLGPGLLEFLGEMLRDRNLTSRVAVITDSNVGPFYLDSVINSLKASGFKPFAYVVPAGEETKNLKQLSRIYTALLNGGLDRRGAIVALGGGVVGDLTGFAAATYMRGVTLVQCPTTLLAMVDSSVGGKTGVDLPQGKNLVGAFKHPLVVVADTLTLESLPDVQVRMGMAELIKHAIIDDADLFAALEASGGNAELEPELVARSVRVKIQVVEEDPFESGRRAVLNLGHTVGHALEKCTNYSMAHGDAVSVGLVAAARISNRLGLCSDRVPERVKSLLAQVGLAVRHSMNSSELVGVMSTDKKAVEGRVRFVLIRAIGTVDHDCDVPPQLVREVLESMVKTA